MKQIILLMIFFLSVSSFHDSLKVPEEGTYFQINKSIHHNDTYTISKIGITQDDFKITNSSIPINSEDVICMIKFNYTRGIIEFGLFPNSIEIYNPPYDTTFSLLYPINLNKLEYNRITGEISKGENLKFNF